MTGLLYAMSIIALSLLQAFSTKGSQSWVRQFLEEVRRASDWSQGWPYSDGVKFAADVMAWFVAKENTEEGRYIWRARKVNGRRYRLAKLGGELHGLRTNVTWGQVGPWRAQRFGASAGGRGCHMAHAFRGGGDEDVRGVGGGGGAAATKRQRKEAKLLEVIRRALADDDDEGEDDDQTLLQQVKELVKTMGDPKRKASFRSDPCSIIEKFDKISVGSSAANSKEGDKQTVNPTQHKQSFYSADLWKTTAERYKGDAKIQNAPRIIWNKGDVTSAGVVIRTLEEGVEMRRGRGQDNSLHTRASEIDATRTHKAIHGACGQRWLRHSSGRSSTAMDSY